jgi:uncharacterized protein YndB with AHSA1/START domain
VTTLEMDTTDAPVQKSVTVRAGLERAFDVFTAGFDTWWPRSHHIGKSPMRKAIIEGRVGGRCYSEQEDDSACPWGTVLVWEPPHRFVMAWQIGASWQYEPDLARASEVEVTFTAESPSVTRVDLTHRHFNRQGAAGDTMRHAVGAAGGWADLLAIFASQAAASGDAD